MPSAKDTALSQTLVSEESVWNSELFSYEFFFSLQKIEDMI